jgi:aminopeptidase N
LAAALLSKPGMPAHDYDVRHINIDLHFDWPHEQAIGTTTITFAPTVVRFRELTLDAGNMTIAAVSLASGAPLKFKYDGKAEKLKVQLDREYAPSDELAVIVAYHTNGPTEQSKTGFGGLAFIKPNPADPARPRQIWTTGEAEFNREWFPCWDHPDDFATTETTLTVDRPLVGISNGRLVDQRDNADGTRTFHWSMEQPHASYLTSIVVGEFATVEDDSAGVPVISYVYPNEADAARATVARVPDMIRFFAERTGAPFPYAKYGQAFLYNFQGGMENITLTALEDGAVRDARSRLDGDNDELLAHELAHSWFGDDLTCQWWSDIWLNEGFATYMQAAWDEHELGMSDFLYRDVLSNQRQYLGAGQGKGRRPTVTAKFEDPDDLFDSYIYARGAGILHMLRRILGDDAWWRGLRLYVQKYPHQAVTTEQFRAALEESSGQKLDWFFDQWVYRMGHPVLRVTQAYDPGAKKLTLTIRQEQKREGSNGYPQTTLYRLPIEVELVARNGSARIEKIDLAAQATQSFSFDVPDLPAIVNFDRESTVIKELKFDKTILELVYQLGNDPDVTGRLWALQELKGKLSNAKGEIADSIRQAVAHALSSDAFWGVRAEAVPLLDPLRAQTDRIALVAASKDPDAHVRQAAVRTLGTSKDRVLAPVYLELLGDPSYAVIEAATVALGQTHDDLAYSALERLVDTPSWHDTITASALSGLAALGDDRALPLAERYAATGHRIEVRVVALKIFAATKTDQRTFNLITEALTQSLELRNFDLWRAAAAALVAARDPRAPEFCVQLSLRFTEPEVVPWIGKLGKQLKKR